MLPLVSLGPICSTFVHSQSHLHFACAQFIPNRSSRLTTFPSILNCWSHKPPKCRSGVSWSELFLGYAHSQMNPPTWTKVGANRSSRFTASPDFGMFDPLTPPQSAPCVPRGNLFGVYPFPDESAHVYQMWCHSDQPFDIFPRLLNLWPPNPPPPMSRGKFYLAYVHSKTNPQTSTNFGANRSSRLTSPRHGFVTP